MSAPIRLTLSILAAIIWLAALPAQAIAQSIIRDAEIERGLQQLGAPIFRAAGLPSGIRIIVLNDSSLNAFVADARHIFIHSGLLLRISDPAQLQAVIAHEAAHIANGHITRRATNAGNMNTAAALGLLLSIAAAAAGAGEGAAALAIGTQSSALRVFFSHTRAEEASADQAGLRYMTSAGINPTAMLDVLELFRGQEVLSNTRQDPYIRTHPLTRDRLRDVQAFVGAQGSEFPTDATTQYWFDRTTAKLSAFLRAPSWTLRRVQRNDNTEIARLSRAIAYHRTPDADAALQEIAALLQIRPNDPYYVELHGQILFESRRYEEAIARYAQAVELAPREPLILAGYGRALLAPDTTNRNRQALDALERARSRDPYDPRMLRDLAVAYARADQNGMASLVTAERYAIAGRMEDAQIHATRAEGLLPRGSGGWLRAQDVLSVAQAAANRRN
jgi:predicted Zn-dependent protease